MHNVTNILEEHGLKKTTPRTEILKVFMRNTTAITHNDLEKELGKDFDRVTIYRTLSSFEEKGLIHKIVPPSGEARYAMCSPHCNEHSHQDTHVHFSCNNCGSVYCLTEIAIPNLKLPKGFKFTSFSFMVEGLCKSCFAKNGTIIRKKGINR